VKEKEETDKSNTNREDWKRRRGNEYRTFGGSSLMTRNIGHSCWPITLEDLHPVCVEDEGKIPKGL